jgi:phenylpyruvate tautomerase PptA (4-oxalocrotonate tautomerase family)
MQPVFVTVLKAQIPKGGALEDEIARLTRVIARFLNLPEANIHILLSSG